MICKIIKNSDDVFPRQLINIKRPPKQLYCYGNIELLNKPSIAVIGSRNCTDYGISICRQFSKYYTQCGIVVVSGLARGIDGVAQKEVVDNGGKTIAVLGGGINNISPKINKELAMKIIDTGGLIVSEYDEDEQFWASNLHDRDRIISGLSVAVLVIEAAEKSGTAITVGFAKEQGKMIFACPGRLDKETGIGVNKFIAEGAKIAVKPENVLNELNIFKNKNLPLDKNQTNNNIREFNEIYTESNKIDEKFILNILDSPKSIEELEQITNYSRMDLLVELTILEGQGIIKNILGVGYQKM